VQHLRGTNVGLIVPESREINRPELQEVKEGIADALVTLIYNRISGQGEVGHEVLGRLPSQAFISGFLMPRFSVTGEDDTSDVHISTIGIDTQVKANAEGKMIIRPSFSLYVRMLPAWNDIEPQREAIARSFRLKREVQEKIKKRHNELIREFRRQAGLPERFEGSDKQMRNAYFGQLKEMSFEAYNQARREVGLPSIENRKALKDIPILAETSSAEENLSVEEGESQEGQEGQSVGGADSLNTLSQIPEHLLMPQPMPMKWQRLTLELPALEVDLGNDDEAIAEQVHIYN